MEKIASNKTNEIKGCLRALTEPIGPSPYVLALADGKKLKAAWMAWKLGMSEEEKHISAVEAYNLCVEHCVPLHFSTYYTGFLAMAAGNKTENDFDQEDLERRAKINKTIEFLCVSFNLTAEEKRSGPFNLYRVLMQSGRYGDAFYIDDCFRFSGQEKRTIGNKEFEARMSKCDYELAALIAKRCNLEKEKIQNAGNLVFLMHLPKFEFEDAEKAAKQFCLEESKVYDTAKSMFIKYLLEGQIESAEKTIRRFRSIESDVGENLESTKKIIRRFKLIEANVRDDIIKTYASSVQSKEHSSAKVAIDSLFQVYFSMPDFENAAKIAKDANFDKDKIHDMALKVLSNFISSGRYVQGLLDYNAKQIIDGFGLTELEIHSEVMKAYASFMRSELYEHAAQVAIFIDLEKESMEADLKLQKVKNRQEAEKRRREERPRQTLRDLDGDTGTRSWHPEQDGVN